MKTLLLSLSLVFFSGLAFGQKISKKEAYEAYKKSNVRIALGYKLSNFKDVYNWKDLTKESLILNSLNKKNLKELTEYEKCAREKAPQLAIGTDMSSKTKDYKNHFDMRCKQIKD